MHFRDCRFIKEFLIVMIAACCLAGCGARPFTYKGEIVTRKDLTVRLQDGNQQGVWKSNELSIAYQYQMGPETLKFAGTLEPAAGYKSFSRLAVYLLFLDNQGVVIESALVYSAGNYRQLVAIPMDFEKTIPIPEGARAISFFYDLSPVQGR